MAETIRQHADHEPLHQLVLTNDNLADLGQQTLQQADLRKVIVCQDEVGEYWPLVDAEPAGLRVVDLGPKEVCGKQVRRKLNPGKLSLNSLR